MSAAAESTALLGVYRPPSFVLNRGEGRRVWDEEGRSYLDFTAGIGVNALGYGSAPVREAFQAALDTGLIHTSNLFRTRPGEALAELLVSLTYPGSVFFCNSGAEANEGAFKFARKWARKAGGEAKHEIVAVRGSFHGRLFGSLAATDRPGYQEPFRPLMAGVRWVDPDDPGTVDAVVRPDRTAAVIAEPLQGEGGIRPLSSTFLHALRAACDHARALLIFDEVQCGLGRTGRLFAYEHSGVVPDILTLAKPLGGGLPMGAVVLAEHVADAVEPGDHATTFGGGPLVSSVALAVLRVLSDPGFLERVRARAGHLELGLADLAARHSRVVELRGLGLMRGVVLDGPAAPVVAVARELGLLVVGAGPRVVRLLPPLTVTDDEIDEALNVLDEALT